MVKLPCARTAGAFGVARQPGGELQRVHTLSANGASDASPATQTLCREQPLSVDLLCSLTGAEKCARARLKVWLRTRHRNFVAQVSWGWMRVCSVAVVEGDTISLSTTICHLAHSGGYVLGFRVDPPDRLKGIYKEIQSLHQVYVSTLRPHAG